MARKSPALGDQSPGPEPASPVATFEDSLESLEALVARMENGDMTLEDSLAAYERGVGLFRQCQQALEHAELRVRLLSDPTQPASAQAFPDLPAGDA
ncbi:MAG TPA: exodeoxyribonuclease VII small subunit [Luteimonas sp.]|nr:exodeoxyribonuclease VII small subunit [Luteimonas sp.]